MNTKAPNAAFATKIKVFTPAGYYSVVFYNSNIISSYFDDHQLRAKTTFMIAPELAGGKHNIIVRGCTLTPYFCF